MALMLGLKALDISNKKVVVPNNVCFSVPQAVLYSGNIPVFLDVDADDFGLSPSRLDQEDDIAAVVAVHAYGRCCKINEIYDICRSRSLPLIEDMAVAQGAYYAGRPAGSFGDISILSFGSGKIIDVGHGGSIMTDDQHIMSEIEKLDLAYPEYTQRHEDEMSGVSAEHTRLYNQQFINSRTVGHDYFVNYLNSHAEFYQFRFDYGYLEVIEGGVNSLELNIELRKEKADKLQHMLAGISEIEIIEHADSDVYWRLNLMVNAGRDELLKKILKKKLKVSSWHPSADIFFTGRQQGSSETPVSDLIGDRILNLWVNSEIDNVYLDAIASEVKDYYQFGLRSKKH